MLPSVLVTKYCLGVQIRKTRLDGACSTCGAGEVHIGFCSRRPDGKRQFGRPRLEERIVLKWIFKMCNGETWTGLIRLRIGTGECGSGNSGSIKCGIFLEYLKTS